ncbi:MAG: PD-(D/E)XK nuclease domain-containing protein [Clostridia bacterium]|nr:PD-(D/E)XK nuclease domain-containing protein [Clostridia bacterium]
MRTCAPTRTFNDEATLADVMRFAYIAAQSEYGIESEAQAGKGYADLIFMPYTTGERLPMVVELKYNKTADEAIGQIEKRHYVKYFDKFSYKGDILFVGINYDSGKGKDGSDGTYTVRFETVKI